MPRLLREMTYRARGLRRRQTPAEARLWALIRNRQVAGAKFRRQQPLGPYIVDFYCVEAGLVIEVDGAGHFPRPQRDRIRDHLFKAAGLTVLRFPNHEVLTRPKHVLARIRQALPSPDAPLSRWERGRG